MKLSQSHDQFIIEALLIDPIEKIMRDLKSGEFRNIDIEWLEQQLAKYYGIAARIFGLHINPRSIECKVLNEYTIEDYHKKFSALLNFFKTIAKNGRE